MVSLGDARLLGIPLRGLNPEGFAIEQLTISQGQPLSSNDRGVVLLGSGIAEALQRPDANQIEMEGRTFRVAGIFQGSNPFDANSVIAPIADVQELMGRPGVISEFLVRVTPEIRDEAALRTVCRAIEGMKDAEQQSLGLKAQTTNQFVATATEARLGSAPSVGNQRNRSRLSLFRHV